MGDVVAIETGHEEEFRIEVRIFQETIEEGDEVLHPYSVLLGQGDDTSGTVLEDLPIFESPSITCTDGARDVHDDIRPTRARSAAKSSLLLLIPSRP